MLWRPAIDDGLIPTCDAHERRPPDRSRATRKTESQSAMVPKGTIAPFINSVLRTSLRDRRRKTAAPVISVAVHAARRAGLVRDS